READDHFAFACRFHDDHGFRLWSARSHLGWAESFAATGQRAPAPEHASRALELARAYGYGLIEARAAPIAGVGAVAGTRRDVRSEKTGSRRRAHPKRTP